MELVPIGDLTLDPTNARKHGKKNLASIKGSLAKFGQQKPIVVDAKGVIIAGNGTFAAAKELGWKEIGIIRTNLSGPEAIAFALADNRTSELAEWDLEHLTPLLQSLKDIDFDLEGIGFDENDLQKLAPDAVNEGLCDEDEVPEFVEPKTKPGDLYQLGKHRLLCGDSTNVQHVERLMGGEKADMVFTDPPYGIDFVPVNIGGKGDASKQMKKIEGDLNTDAAREAYHVFAAWPCKQVIWGGNYFTDFLPVNGAWLVWTKYRFEKETHPFSDCELAWTNFEKQHVKNHCHVWDGMWREGDRASEGKTRMHPNQKPVGLTEKLLDGANVYDAFLGSGSTLIACEKTNRRCFGMEIDPGYCDVIVARWEKFTGKYAILVTSNNNEESNGDDSKSAPMEAGPVGKPKRAAKANT